MVCVTKENKLEKYYYEKNYKKFNIELKKFTGYIVRKFCPGFKQSSEIYEELFDQALVVVYDKLQNEFDPTKGNFRSFVFTKIRGELTKFMNKFNRERKFVDILDFNIPSELQINYDFSNYTIFINIINEIIDEYDLNINANKAISYLLFNVKIAKNRLDRFEMKLISWEFISRYFGKEGVTNETVSII